ncbi:hypothetical protein COLO4_18761 [Corchorus olitorius]|uniref:Uncharacterized protein n=1 Tax=Corchorus olitorius TaxID=93759 RepID=A0A1R3J834_9ROSI|nr:hypothetical protein COLO4_18761 [Corchorus olitorius]
MAQGQTNPMPSACDEILDGGTSKMCNHNSK